VAQRRIRALIPFSISMPDTILIVDDTPANVSVLLQCLGDRGYRLMVAEDGEEALAQIARTVPDLVLLDVMMPGIDGFETCRRIHSKPASADLPVIFMTALTDTSEKVRGFAAGAVDYITKPVRHEEALARVSTHLALRRLRHALRQELELKERFMRIAAHDLRNPLFLILMAAELAKRQVDAVPGLECPLNDIHESAQQMRRIIDTFLQLKPPGADPLKQRIDLSALASAVASQNEPAAQRKQISVVMDLAPNLPLACGDVAHAYQALTNYLTNSLKFTPPGGRVVVRTRRAGARIRVEVEDNGPGVKPAERAKLFTEYAHLSNRPTGGEESNGLGLAIVQQLIRALNGDVGAEFPATGGSIFWFELPAV
jgi:signal transduction histidine kinase